MLSVFLEMVFTLAPYLSDYKRNNNNLFRISGLYLNQWVNI